MTLEDRITRLEDIEALRQLQARYQRCLDTRDFDGLASCFTADAVSAYDSGEMAYEGREAIIDFLRGALTRHIHCSHLIHGGEFSFADPTHATGLWYLEDYLLHTLFFVKMHGAAIYHIDYRKEPDGWRICRIGYDRSYQYFERRSLLNIFTLAHRSSSYKLWLKNK